MMSELEIKIEKPTEQFGVEQLVIRIGCDYTEQFYNLLNELKETEAENYTENYWDSEKHNAQYTKEPYIFAGAYLGDSLVGYIIAWKKNEYIFEIFNMYIKKTLRGRGIGKKLLKFVIGYAKNSGAKILASNIADDNYASKKIHNSWIPDRLENGWQRYYYIIPQAANSV